MTPTTLLKATLSSGLTLSLRCLSLVPTFCSHPGHNPGLRCSPVSAAVKQMLKPTPTCGSSPQREILLSHETSHILASSCTACSRTEYIHPRSHKERQLPLCTGFGDLPSLQAPSQQDQPGPQWDGMGGTEAGQLDKWANCW